MADCCVIPDPRGDFAGWMAAKGGQATFAQAMAQELGIRDYEALLACSEDTQVQQELMAIARERLPFAFYAVLRRLVRSLFPSPPCSTSHTEEPSACSGVAKPLSLALLDAIMATLRGLSEELLLSAQRFSELTPGFLPPAPACPHTETSCIQQFSELGDSPIQPVEVTANGHLEDNSIDGEDPSVKPEPTDSYAGTITIL
uniref:uncharacterized protein isoform X2 n=1 Tax=Myxine glutinosa TaxID=7769 RepID=UPI00358E3961